MTSPTALRLDRIEQRLGQIDERLGELNLNGHAKDLLTLAEASGDLVTLAKVAPALSILAASAAAIGSLVRDEAVLRDMADHRTEQKKLQDAKDYVQAHARVELLRRFGRPLNIARWLAPFVVGAAAFRVMTWIDPAPLLHLFGAH